jgi:hypothetical protein
VGLTSAGIALQIFTKCASLRLFITKRLGTVIARNVITSLRTKSRRVKMTPQEVFRQIEEHIEALANYDVIDADVAETLTSYIFKFMLEIDTIEEPDADEEIENVISIWSRHLDEITKEPETTSQKDENDEETN